MKRVTHKNTGEKTIGDETAIWYGKQANVVIGGTFTPATTSQPIRTGHRIHHFGYSARI